MILLIDNYDSFVFNLARYFERLGHEAHVVRNDAVSIAEVQALAPQAIVISPGPCTPNEAGCSLEVVRRLGDAIPILGICLGHQAIAAAYGGQIVRAAEPMHGRTSPIMHAGRSVFAGLPSPLVACRYHSLVVERSALPEVLEVTAWTADGTIMALAHRAMPVVGLQFHPESVLTDGGYDLLAAFLRVAGLHAPARIPSIESERAAEAPAQPVLPERPVTF
jgi:anthranilate synthase/aminodeoxychorismate synthase-like glutamine amidotransferase